MSSLTEISFVLSGAKGLMSDPVRPLKGIRAKRGQGELIMGITKLVGIVFLGALTGAVPVNAQELTLRAVTAFAEGTQFSQGFERFIEKVNKDGKGVIQINYIGGPRAMPPFEVGNAVRSKVVDIANVAGAYYTGLMPEADAFKLL